jgi:hypothetical protein
MTSLAIKPTVMFGETTDVGVRPKRRVRSLSGETALEVIGGRNLARGRARVGWGRPEERKYRLDGQRGCSS